MPNSTSSSPRPLPTHRRLPRHHVGRGRRGDGERRGRVVKHNKAQDPARCADRYLGDVRTGPAPGRGRQIRLRRLPRSLRRTARGIRRHRYRLLGHHLRAARRDRRNRLALSLHRPSGHAPALRGRQDLPPRRQDPYAGRRMAPADGPVQRRVPHDAHDRTHRRPLPLRQPDPSSGCPRRTDPATLGGGPPLTRFPQWPAGPRRQPARQHGLPALVTEAIRPDTVFIPYHWPAPTSANVLTIDALDPRSKIPEYKVCACRIEHADEIDEVPAPPVAPGHVAYPETQVSRTDPLPPTSPQGRGTSERG
ncbi:molybdopterin dinucleotide binding domain-containing protein [Streptomyces sp. M10(2022)]